MGPKIFSTLSCLQNLAERLSESHLLQQCKSEEHELALAKLIVSAFHDLEQCVKILNTCAPISRILSADILSLIFDAAQEEDHIRPSIEPTSSTEPLTCIPVSIRLSQVSRSWRNITTSLPLLWTHIRISSPWRFQSIRAFLSNSKSLPIQLKIIDIPASELTSDCVEEDVAKEGEHAKLLCDILAPHMHRCRSISVITSNDTWPLLMEMRDRFQGLDAQLLEQAVLICEDFDFEYGPQLLFGRAPLLAVLQLNIHALIICYPPLSHLVSLHLTGASSTVALAPSDLFDNLSRCLMLEHLYLYGEVADDDGRTGIYSLLALRSLHLYGDSVYTRSLVLCHIMAPLLDVILIAPFYSDDFYMENLVDLGGRRQQRFPALKTLSLAVDNASDEWFNDVTICFPSVENLVLGGVSGGLVPGSLTRDQYAKLLPNLRTFSLRNISFGASEDELCKFITLRKAANIMLPEILLNSASLVNMRRLDWLETQVEVTVHDPWLDQEGQSGSVATAFMELRI